MAEKDGKEQDPDFEMAPPVPTLSADAKAKPWRTERNELMCRLTDEEQRMRGQQLAAALKNYGVEEEQAKRHKEAMKALEEQAAKLREAVLHKEELRQVTCILVPDYEAATVTTFRADTGEMVTVRALEMSERQQELPLSGASDDDLLCICGHPKKAHAPAAEEDKPGAGCCSECVCELFEMETKTNLDDGNGGDGEAVKVEDAAPVKAGDDDPDWDAMLPDNTILCETCALFLSELCRNKEKVSTAHACKKYRKAESAAQPADTGVAKKKGKKKG